MYRKNTASQYIYFVLVNASSGAALTGATVTAYRALDGGSQASATGTTTELANGQYRFNLSQADTNADYGSYLFTATNAVPVEKTVVFTGADVTAAAFGAALASNYTATVIVQPLSATQPEAVIGTRIPRAVGDVSPIPVDIYDSTGAAVNLTTLGNLEVCVETEANVDLQVVAHANLTISGPSNNKVTWTPNAASVATVAKHRWSLRVASNKKDIAHGVFEVLRVALSDA